MQCVIIQIHALLTQSFLANVLPTHVALTPDQSVNRNQLKSIN